MSIFTSLFTAVGLQAQYSKPATRNEDTAKTAYAAQPLKHFIAAGIIMGLSSSAWAGWEVQWIDKFDGNGVDWENWTAQTEADYNNEVQCYTADDNSSERNYDVSDGTLKIIARKKPNFCSDLGKYKAWTSGRLNSKDKQEFLFGRIEARIKFHNLEAGTWPAFWMLENRIAEQPIKGDGDNVGWPLPGAGEIDVWEWFSNEPGSYITNFYNASNCGGEFRYRYPNGAQDVQDWHKYAVEWTAEKIDFYVDETLVISRDVRACAQYKEPMFALLNVAMGGNLGGFIDPDLTQATMEVDYIAHCQPSANSDAIYCDESAPVADENPGGVAPSVQLAISQSGAIGDEIDPDAGEVVITTQLDDSETDNYTFEWQTDELPSPVISGQRVSFDPASMLDGSYSVSITVTDQGSNLSGEAQLDFTVSSAVELPAAPSDSSGGSSGLFALLSLFGLLLLRKKR
ncbi:family 16 glycosylhydrolase [Agarivorans sp. TSD2052]|uniref:family 16 glycosylhydrolase n=1 Tax=Agarivorans sp. TSD2052 TaxID=2937286 RepID=UPI00200EB663|nr:family 16 glycosylhydrolase [Agarivorans sp. TSD2052]UPW19545.1 family 16 glycosylhydrolase [Agarivorans sp. TSD2052]